MGISTTDNEEGQQEETDGRQQRPRPHHDRRRLGKLGVSSYNSTSANNDSASSMITSKPKQEEGRRKSRTTTTTTNKATIDYDNTYFRTDHGPVLVVDQRCDDDTYCTSYISLEEESRTQRSAASSIQSFTSFLSVNTGLIAVRGTTRKKSKSNKRSKKSTTLSRTPTIVVSLEERKQREKLRRQRRKELRQRRLEEQAKAGNDEEAQKQSKPKKKIKRKVMKLRHPQTNHLTKITSIDSMDDGTTEISLDGNLALEKKPSFSFVNPLALFGRQPSTESARLRGLALRKRETRRAANEQKRCGHEEQQELRRRLRRHEEAAKTATVEAGTIKNGNQIEELTIPILSIIDAAVSNAAVFWSSSSPPSPLSSPPTSESKSDNGRDVVVSDLEETSDGSIPILTMIDAASNEPIPSFSSSFGSSFVQNQQQQDKEAEIPSPADNVIDRQLQQPNKYKDQLRKSRGRIKDGISSLKSNRNDTTKSDDWEGICVKNKYNNTSENPDPSRSLESSTPQLKANTDVEGVVDLKKTAKLPSTERPPLGPSRPPLDPSLSKRKTMKSMFGSWKNKNSNKKNDVTKTNSKTSKLASSSSSSSSSSPPPAATMNKSGTKISKSRVQALVQSRSGGGDELRDGVPLPPPPPPPPPQEQEQPSSSAARIHRAVSRKQVQNNLQQPSTTKRMGIAAARPVPQFMIYRTSSGSSSVHENLIDLPSFHQSFSSGSVFDEAGDDFGSHDDKNNSMPKDANLIRGRSPSLNALNDEIRKDENITGKQDHDQQRDDVGDVATITTTTTSVVGDKDGSTHVTKDDGDEEDDFAFSSDEFGLSDISTSEGEDDSESDSDDDEEDDNSSHYEEEVEEDDVDDLDYMDSLDESEFFSDEDGFNDDDDDDGVDRIDVMTGMKMMYESQFQYMKRSIDSEVEGMKQGLMNLLVSQETKAVSAE
jgi:hypothetical protein